MRLINSQPSGLSIVHPSNLEALDDQLRSNSDVYYPGPIITYNVSGIREKTFETASLIVAPLEPLLRPDLLNNFMHELIQGIKPNMVDEAYSQDGGIHLGKLYFDEAIGLENQRYSEEGIADTQRRIWIRPYTDSATAHVVYLYELGRTEGIMERNRDGLSHLLYWITREQLEKIKNNLGPRQEGVFGLLPGSRK